MLRKLQSVAAMVVMACALVRCGGDLVSSVVEGPWLADCQVTATITNPTTLAITGSCPFTSIGPMRVTTTQTIRTRASGVVDYENVTTYTALDGDELRASSVGTATPTDTGLNLAGVEKAKGGTGKYKNASGQATLAGTVKYLSATSTSGSYRFSGKLAY